VVYTTQERTLSNIANHCNNPHSKMVVMSNVPNFKRWRHSIYS